MTHIPGIYIEEAPDERRGGYASFIETRCLTGFVGFAEQGPAHTPVLLTSFGEYSRVFGGFDTRGTLPFSVYHYFLCGGTECVVTRIVAEARAARACITLKCSAGGAITLEAKTLGAWGNTIRAQVWHDGIALVPRAVDTRHCCAVTLADTSCLLPNDILRITVAGRRIFRRVTRIAEDVAYLNVPLGLLRSVDDPVRDITVELAVFSLRLSRKGGKTERYCRLSMNPASAAYYRSVINVRSELCVAHPRFPRGMVRPVFSRSGAGGSDGLAYITAQDFIGHYHSRDDCRGLAAFESRDDVALIAAPDAGRFDEPRLREIHAAMLNQAERFPARFALLDIPGDWEYARLCAYLDGFDSAHAAAYYPDLDISDPRDPSRGRSTRIPPSGAVAGLIARTDATKGIFQAAANLPLPAATGVSKRITDAEYETLYSRGLNLIKHFPGRGVKLWGARTLSRDPSWRYINARRAFDAIREGLKRGMQWAVFEVNDRNLRKRLTRQVSGFLLDLWMTGYLTGNTAEQGFFTRCDDELNPPEALDSGMISIEVGLAISRPMEFLKITLTTEREGSRVRTREAD
ncbi:MAG: phage tail sheath subtilisin-like domain-containing protein [Treponema sp.]|jgi:hypothetical protein|nr:phage tail sheath subtilisin-like domain-containing protein [Treponema sp.]